MHHVIVTGGAGFIGHHLVKKLITKNYQVDIIDNLSNNNSRFTNELMADRHLYSNTLLYNCDIRDESGLSDIFKNKHIDACVHLAAKISVPESLVKPFETIDVNVKGTLNVLEACSKYNVPNLVFASSAAVYGHSSKLPIPEDIRLEPISPYGSSKVAAEALVSSYRSKIKNCLSLRFFNIYGKGQTAAYAGVITKFIERLSSRSAPVIYGSGYQTRDFISVNDVVDAIILAAQNHDQNGTSTETSNAINIGTGRPTAILDLAFMLISIFKLEKVIRPEHSDTLVGDIIHSYPEICRARDELKFIAREDLRTGLLKLINSSGLQKQSG